MRSLKIAPLDILPSSCYNVDKVLCNVKYLLN